jgi:predicted metal-dependent hydrolase
MVIELSPALRAVHYDANGRPQHWKKIKMDCLDVVLSKMGDDIEAVRQEADMVAPTACGW